MRKIPVAVPTIGEEEVAKVTEAVKSGWVSQGENIELFEKNFCKLLGVKHCISLSSGTASLEVAFRSLELSGKEVITCTSSCAAAVNAILHADCKPVFVDADPVTYNIAVDQVESHITDNTKAIMPIHLYGHPCDMDPILELAEKHDLFIIEDCAQALGSKYKDKAVGSLGNASCHAFYANKLITTGEGGMLATDNNEVAEKARIIRNHGQGNTPFVHPLYGYNFKMSNLHAALGVAQLSKLDTFIKKRRENASLFNEGLKDMKDLQLPKEMDYAFHVYFSYPILLKKENLRDELCKYLADNGIETRNMFSPMSSQPFFEKMFGKYPENFSNAEKIAQNGFYVSCSPSLTKEDTSYIIDHIKKGLER